jgi:hypothetical protein
MSLGRIHVFTSPFKSKENIRFISNAPSPAQPSPAQVYEVEVDSVSENKYSPEKQRLN